MTPDDGPTQPGGDTLRDHLARALHDVDPTLSERLTHDADAHLELVALARAARSETDVLLAAAVQSARSAGCTWEQVGSVLGMTRQAAQQRYGQPDASATAATTGGGSRPQLILRPLTAFNEMSVLARASRYGWHSVAYGPLFHIVERDDRQWEHTRTHGSVPSGDGWMPVGSGWAWWSYWARPTDAPALDGDPSATELVRG
ncbi:hypothetical protein ACGIF2_07545 [Cellulomonas sp. P22]|uniref:hypothetical protein n=1 Tax=Cellulomonas sp. P22 TaxID=3373189 RepID=UPI0037918D54